MANLFTNRLTVYGEYEQVHQVLDFIKKEKCEYDGDVCGIGTIDFNKITPKPMWIEKIERFVSEMDSLEQMHAYEVKKENEYDKCKDAKLAAVDDDEFLFRDEKHKKAAEYVEKTLWLEDFNPERWYMRNWGTQYNAYEQGDKRNTDNTIYFKTAWCGVPKLMHKLACIFPDVEIEYSYCEEFIGSDCGRFRFKFIDMLEASVFIRNSKASYDLWFDIEQIKPEKFNMRFNEEICDYEVYDPHTLEVLRRMNIRND